MGYKFSGPLWSGFREALQAAPGHTAVAFFKWDAPGIFGRKKKEYFITISQVTEQEGRRRFGNAWDANKAIVVACAGDFPPSVRERLGSDEPIRGWSVTWEGFMLLMAQYFPEATAGEWELS